MVSLLFPGQGSQYQGMGRTLADTSAAAQEVFQMADAALGFEISKLCFEGSEEELRRTELTQPAILTTSIAAWRAFCSRHSDMTEPRFVAGHSLGEWSALVVAGALSFQDAVRLVHERGRLMQQAVPLGEGAMLAVIGLSPDEVSRLCAEVEAQEGAVFKPANFNSSEQVVVSGHARAAEKAQQLFSEAGAKKVVPLPVSAPFHSPLMKSAREGLKLALEPVTVNPLSVPVVTNVEAQPNSDPKRVKDLLVEQVTAPVRWVEVIQHIVEQGETLALELGPGRVLMGLARRIDRRLKVLPVGDPETLEKALTQL